MIDITEAMIRQIQEAERTMELATNEIIDLRAMIHDLQIENERLRARTTNYAMRLKDYEEGSL